MSSVEERVTRLTFDNAQFEQGIKTTLASLDALNKGLKLENATKGLSDLDAAGKKVDLGHIASAVDGIAQKFQAMSVIAISALATVATKAAETGLNLVKSLSISPVLDGFHEYEINLNSIQTILGNTKAAATTLEQVTHALDELNHYADLTIYSFSEMAKNIGTFTAAGVALEPAVAAIKGIANLAALSGSNSLQAATAMYQLSQAISTGTVKLIDWNSVVNAGMGGTVFQRALAQTAVVMGTLNESAVKLEGTMKTVTIGGGSFRDSLRDGWLTAEVLTNTLAQFTGDLTDAQLATLGFSAAQVKAIQDQAKAAQRAATEVKTMSQLFGALKESVGSGWAQTWQLVFGNFDEARMLFTNVYRSLDSTIGGISDARNELLSGWHDLGGRTLLIEAFTEAIGALGDVVKPIVGAFRDIFPPMTAKRLYEITENLYLFFSSLRQGEETINNIRRTAAGVFAVFDIGYQVLKQVLRIFFQLAGAATEGGGGILEFTGNIGDFLVAIDKAIKNGEDLTMFFDNIGRILMIPIDALHQLGYLLGGLFDGFDGDKAAESVKNLVSGVDPLTGLANIIVAAWSNVLRIFDNIFTFITPFANKMAEVFHDISVAVGGLNFDTLLHSINTGALAAIVGVLYHALGHGGVGGVISELTSTLSSMQSTLRAATLLQIALAIVVLAGAAAVLASVDSSKLTKSLGAIAVMFTQLVITLAALNQVPNTRPVRLYVTAAALTVLAVAIGALSLSVKLLADLDPEALHRGLISTALLIGTVVAAARSMPSGAELINTGTSLLILSGAILLLTKSVKDLADMNWEELSRGLSGVAALLAALTLFTRFAEANATGVLAGAGIVLLASGIKILASAVMDLSGVSWENIGKGMATLATSLLLITAALDTIPPTAPLQATGIAIVAASLLILSQAIQSMTGISWENVGKGMTIIATALLLIGIALDAISPTAALSAAGVLIISAALLILAQALVKMGNMKWGQILKSLVTMGVALGLITAAMILMQGSIGGAAALLIVAGALTILAVVLKTLGSMKWGEIVKGIATLAAVFVVLGVAGALLTPVIPTLLGLGAAITLLGLGLALAGAGVFLFAAGITALSVAGAAGAAAIVGIISAVIGLLPAIVEQIGVALIILLDILIEAVPKIVELIVKLIAQLLKALEGLLPDLGKFILKLILVVLTILKEAIPRLVEAGYAILLGVLKGISDNIGKATDAATRVVTEFLKALGRNIPKGVDAGFKMMIAVMDGIGKAVHDNSDEVGRAGADLAFNLVTGVLRGLDSFGGRIKEKLLKIAKDAWDSVLDFLGINSPSTEGEWAGEMVDLGIVRGLDIHAKVVERAAVGVGDSLMKGLSSSLANVADMVDQNVDLTPTITPVLDLSDVQRKSGEMWAMLNRKPIWIEAALASASAIDSAVRQNQDDGTNDNPPGDTFNYTQNNYSPKPLSTAEIYRNTKNQLSAKKGVLTT